MDKLEQFNRRFGNWYEGLFGASSERELRPRDILRRIVQVMEDERREGLRGEIVYVPNVYTLEIAVGSDRERDYLRAVLDADELAGAVREAIGKRGYRTVGGLRFEIKERPAGEKADKAEKGAGGNNARFTITTNFDKSVPDQAVAVAAGPNANEGHDDGTVIGPVIPLASLVIRRPNGQADVHPLGTASVAIGRSKQSANGIVLAEDALASRSHARIAWENGRFLLFDERSSNGTFVNGVPLAPLQGYTLQANDEIRVGNTTLTFRPQASAAPEPRPVAAPTNFPPNAYMPSVAPPGVAPSGVTLQMEGRGLTNRLRGEDGGELTLSSNTVVGSAPGCDLMLSGRGIAERHARFFLHNNRFSLEDLGTNGLTCVNDLPIRAQLPVALYNGDHITFGEMGFRFEQGMG